MTPELQSEKGGILYDQERGSTLTAVKDSLLLSLSREKFDALSSAHLILAKNLLKWLLGRISLRLKMNSERLAHVL